MQLHGAGGGLPSMHKYILKVRLDRKRVVLDTFFQKDLVMLPSEHELASYRPLYADIQVRYHFTNDGHVTLFTIILGQILAVYIVHRETRQVRRQAFVYLNRIMPRLDRYNLEYVFYDMSEESLGGALMVFSDISIALQLQPDGKTVLLPKSQFLLKSIRD